MNPRISIIHIAREAEGGMKKSVIQLLRGLDRERFNPSFIAAEPMIAAVQAGGVSDVESLSAYIGDAVGLVSLAALPLMTAFFKRQPNPRIIHAHGYVAALVGATIARATGAVFIYTAHNALSQRASPVTRMAAQIATRRAKKVIAVSEGVRKSLEHIGARTDKITVIPNGVEIPETIEFDRESKLRELGLPNARVILCVARLTPVKGVRYLVEAIPAIKHGIADAATLIAGDGPEMTTLRELDKKINDNSGAVFLGQREDIADLLLTADVVVVPSVEEGQGLVALEAMAAGRPVVASAVGGLAETIDHNVTGFLTPPCDSIAIADAVVQILTDAELAERLGSAGREFVSLEMTVDRMLSRTMELYQECAR